MTSILALDSFLSSESEGEDFNPAQQVESDEDEISAPVKSKRSSRKASDDEDDDDDMKVARSPSANDDDDDDEDLPRGTMAGSDEKDQVEGDDDDADEDEDEDDEEHEENGDRPRKRHKRLRRMQFIDEEAEVDDEDEEEEVEDDELLEDVDDAVDAPPGAEHDDRGHRELDRQRQVAMDLDAEKQAEALRQKYGRQSRSAVAQVSGIPQHLLLPSVDDPMIWAVRCKNGKENEVINSIMKRFADRMHTREPLGITAAFVRAGSTMSGYVYVEARRKDQVDKAVEEISFCYPRTKTMLIPIKEMPDLLRVTKPKSVEIGMYCRLKRPPKYAGDLAQIVGVEANGSELTVRIIPRLDYGQEDDPHGPQGPAKRKRAGGAGGRPPQRLFNEVEARKKFGAKLQPASGSYNRVFLFHSESYEDGFLVKDVKIGTVQLEDVNATLEEVTRFAAGDEGGLAKLDLSAIAETMKKGTITGEFLPDDVVEIYQGEQQGVRGKATAVQGDIVTIKVSHGPLKGEIVQAPVRTLRKLFDEGDHVKVTGASKYQGEVGMVVRVKDDRITLITDADNQEITVFSRDLRAAMDSSGPILGSKYALFDLVQLDAATVACVVKVERESLKVLDQHGSVRTVLPSSITQKLDNGPRTVATDRDGNEVHANDTVKEYSGEQRSGNVLHVHRNFLFCHDRTGMENVGVFVVRSAGVTILSAVGGRVTNTAIDLTKMNPALLQPGASNGGAMGPPKNLAMRDRLPGKTVLIKKGPFKGLVGLVKDTTATHARVELHSRKNLATVPKEDLVMKDPFTGETIQFGPGNRRPGTMGPPGGYGNNGISPRTPLAGSRTPMGVPSGGRTPAWQQGDGGRTPAWKQGGGVEGGRTPAWANASGGRTPAWQPDGGRTVNPYANDGGTTSYGGTSAWSSGSKTPSYYGNSAPTPAASGSSAWGANAATPAGLDAPTPGYLAPTPAAVDMPTPRGGYAYGTPAASAPTPGAFAETPGAYNAETPAAFGDDDEPRYD